MLILESSLFVSHKHDVGFNVLFKLRGPGRLN
jgi:hypothetical protein